MEEYLERLESELGPDYEIELFHALMQSKVTCKGKTLCTSQMVEPSADLQAAAVDAAEQIKTAFGVK